MGLIPDEPLRSIFSAEYRESRLKPTGERLQGNTCGGARFENGLSLPHSFLIEVCLFTEDMSATGGLWGFFMHFEVLCGLSL